MALIPTYFPFIGVRVIKFGLLNLPGFSVLTINIPKQFCSYTSRKISLPFFLSFFLLSVSSTYLYSQTHNSKDVSDKQNLIEKKRLQTIIVGNYYPYTFVNDAGKPDGFSVDLIKAVTKAMNLELKIQVHAWDKARSSLETGKIDLLPMMAYSKDRDKYFDFSAPHTIAFDAFFTRKDTKKIKSLNDLRNKNIIVMTQDQAYDFLNSVDYITPEQLILIGSISEALRLLASGVGDAAIMPKLVGLVAIKRSNFTNLEMSPIVIESYNRPFSFAVKEGNQVLQERLTQGLNIVKETGQYQTIYKKWFGAYEPSVIKLSMVLKYVLWSGAALVFLYAILALWSLSLKKQVAVRTRRLEKEIEIRKKAEAELKRAHDKLDYRVTERTSELMESNKQLEIEINERKQVEESLLFEMVQRKQIEEQRKTLLEDLVCANTELKDFSYTVSHDLKAPLRGINSIVRWLSEDYSKSLDKKGNEYLDKLLLRTKRMDNLIEGILQYSRIGRFSAKPQKIDCKIIFQEIVDTLSPPENIKVTIEQPLPTIFYDKTLFRQVGQNLIENAVKHFGKPSGEVVISCSGQGGSWEFCIKDNGVGIEAKHHDRIFKIFQSLKPHSTDSSTGIGLSLVKKIIENNKGIIRLKSSANEGSSFFFTIPKKEESEGIELNSQVLIVDDNIEFIEVATALLKNSGYKPLSACSGPEAYEILETSQETISVVLFDIDIPNENPLDRYNTLRQIKPDLKIIVCTGLNIENNDLMEQIKADGILTKPFTIDELIDVLIDK